MITLSDKDARLLIPFLEDLGNKYGNAGCNDWQWPDDWTQDERDEFIRSYNNHNGSPEYNEDDIPARQYQMDFVILYELQARIEDQLT